MRIFYDLAGFGLAQIIIFGCFFMGGFYFFKYDDGSSLRQETVAVQENIKKMEVDIRSQEAELKKAEEFKEALAKEAQNVNYLLNYLPNELSPVDIFSILTKEARSTGVNIEDKRDSPLETGEYYDTLKIHLTVKGSFSHVLSFMSQLTDQKWILVVNTVAMSEESKDGGLKANLDISAFRYKDVAKGAADGQEGENSGGGAAEGGQT